MNVRPYRDHNPVMGQRVWIGPARRVRALRAEEIDKLAESAAHHVALKDDYLAAGPAG